MDLVADFANLRRVGRAEALSETLPWILYCLHRRDVERAELARTDAQAVNLATASAFGSEAGSRALQDFFAEQEQLIAHDPFAPVDPSQPTAEEIAFFEKQHARALAAQRQSSPS